MTAVPMTERPRQSEAGVRPAVACAMLLCAAFFWGAGNVANKTVLEHVGPLAAVGLRSVIACAVILPLAVIEWRRAPPGSAWVKGALRVSVFFAAALALQQYAYLSTTVTNASFLVNTAGILTPILAWMLFGDRPGVRIVLAAPLTLLGAFLMAGATFRLSSLNPGDIYCLASALMYAAWMVALGRHAMAHGRPFGTSFMQFAVSAVVMLPLSALGETTTLAGVRAAVPELLMLGVFSTAVAFAIQTYAQRFVSSSTAAVLVSAESLFGAAGAVLILGEYTPAIGVAGAALILIAILLVATADHGSRAKVADPPLALPPPVPVHPVQPQEPDLRAPPEPTRLPEREVA